MTEPPQTATSFFKIAPSQLATFGWNMTSVIASPTHLTVSAKCDNGNTYPVGPATDGVIDGDATQVVWDIYSYQQSHNGAPLPQGTCTLLICDERGFGASRLGGYMVPNSALTFALYTPAGYTPLASGALPFTFPFYFLLTDGAGWECTICNSSFSSYVAQPTIITIVATFLVVFLSGFQLLRNAARAVA